MQPSAPSLVTESPADFSVQLTMLARLAVEGGEGLVVTDAQGRCLLLNELATRLCGGAPAEPGELSMETYLAQLRAQSHHADDTWPMAAGPLDMAALASSLRWLCFTSSAGCTGQERRYTLVPTALRDNAGVVVGYALFLRDITALLQDDALENGLLSSVSHDLRTPLMVIKAAVTGLLQEELEWDEVVRREMLQDINEEADRLTTLVSALLEMSRIQGGALQLQTEWCDLAEIIHTVLDRLQKVTRYHRIVYDVRLPLPLIQGDFVQLDRVLSNLVENAVKYSPQGTEIRITACVVEAEVQVSVVDQGCGIQPEERERIFEKFYRVKQQRVRPARDGRLRSSQDGAVDRSLPSLAGGSGLGLAICRGILRAHRGRIRVEPGDEGGSRFVFTLPVEPSAPMSGGVARDSGPLAGIERSQAPQGEEPLRPLPPDAGWEGDEDTDDVD